MRWTYDQMVQLFEQQKVESFQFTDSSTLVMKLKDSEQRCAAGSMTIRSFTVISTIW